MHAPAIIAASAEAETATPRRLTIIYKSNRLFERTGTGWYPEPVQAVPLSFFLFLVEFAVGGLIVSVLLDWDGEVSKGFLFLNGLFLLGAVVLGIWLRGVLPAARLLDYPAGYPWIEWEIAAWAAFAVLTALQLVFLKTERERGSQFAGGGAAIAGLAALAVTASAYANPALSVPWLLASLLLGSLALGTAWTGMMLGHWYLVTPLLAPRPLLRLNASMALAVVAQGALLAGVLISRPATSGIEAPGIDWLLWLRAAVGILFPAMLAVPIWRTARVRSMMSATGLLYVALGTVLSGEIMAKALYFVSGLPV